VNGKIPIKSLIKFFNNERVTKGYGEIEVNDFKIKGDLDDMRSMRKISRVDASGTFDFDDAGVSIEDEQLIIDRGALVIKDNKLTAKGVKIEGAGSEFTLNGYCNNLLPVLFADSTNRDEVELDFSTKLNARKLDVKTFISVFQNKEDTESNQNGWHNNISGFLNGTVAAEVEYFFYDKLKGNDFEGRVIFEGDELFLDGDFDTMKGSMSMEGEMDLDVKPVLKANLTCDGIDVKQFFTQADNFGQEAIVAKNLRGRMDSNIKINAYWDKKGQFLEKDLTVLSHLILKNGELVDLKILEDFAAFIKIEDLKRIKFTQLENYFEVRKGRIKIPVMFIQNNAVNLTVSGHQTFENELKYNIKLNAGQVLMNRIKKYDRALKPMRAKHKGWNLYYVISGNVDNYKIRKDRKEVIKRFELSELHKKRIKTSLEKEFDENNIKEGMYSDNVEKVSKKEREEIEKEVEKEKKIVEEEEKIIAKKEEEESIDIPEPDNVDVDKTVWDN